jgi:hypothetical protein
MARTSLVCSSLLLVITIVAPSERVSAQSGRLETAVDSGLVIRLTRGEQMVRGRLLQRMAPAADSAHFCRFPGPPCFDPISPNQIATLSLADWEHLDVQVGNRAKKGAVLGGILGGLFTIVAAGYVSAFCDYDCPGDGELLVKSAVLGGLFWGGAGAVIGSGFPRFERRF